MNKQEMISELKVAAEYFQRSTRCLDEVDSSFAPKEPLFSVAKHVAHAAQTIDWFLDGAFRPQGFDLDFEKHDREVSACTSLTAARKWFDQAISKAIETISAKSDSELTEALPEGPVMGGQPRYAIIVAITDHTAHHRGALTVYSRLLGKVPPMPYMEA